MSIVIKILFTRSKKDNPKAKALGLLQLSNIYFFNNAGMLFVFIPRANAGSRPAFVVELKYNKDADTAIRQIKEKRYHGALEGYTDKILLVGVNYDADGDNKKHTCVIEEINI